ATASSPYPPASTRRSWLTASARAQPAMPLTAAAAATASWRATAPTPCSAAAAAANCRQPTADADRSEEQVRLQWGARLDGVLPEVLDPGFPQHLLVDQEAATAGRHRLHQYRVGRIGDDFRGAATGHVDAGDHLQCVGGDHRPRPQAIDRHLAGELGG